MKLLLKTTLGRLATPMENSLRLFGLGVLAGLCVACGQKGPPLAPIVYLPRPVSELIVKRVEGDVVLQFKVPSANTDGTTPADLERVEVYAHTGPLPTPADFLKYGTLVKSIEVKQPAEPTTETEEQRAEGKRQGLSTDLPTVASDAKAGAPSGAEVGVEQGWATNVRETLTDAHREIGPMPPTRAIVPVVPVAGAAQIETIETPGTVNLPLPPARYYTVVAVSESRNRRTYAGPIRVPLVPPLESPGEVSTSYTPDAIVLSWPGHPEDIAVPVPVAVVAPSAAVPEPAASATAPGAGVPGPAPSAEVPAPVSPPAAPSAERPAPSAERPAIDEDRNQETAGTHEIYAAVETAETVDAPIAAGAAIGKPQPPPTPRFGYNVYEVASSAPVAPTSAPDGASASATDVATVDRPPAPVVPLNTALLTAPIFKDTRVEFGTERCYAVRRVEIVGTIAIESGASPAICVTPVDTFPPAAPASLAHVASGTEVSLIWEASTEADLAGYLVLRGEAPGDKLAPLTAAPISDASYVDTSVSRNRSYVYEVVAIDKSGNQSAPSNRVEETIR